MTARHTAGAATYPGNVEHIVGEVKGPRTYGGYLIASTATHDPATETTRVGFVVALDDDEVVADEHGVRRMVSPW